MSRRMSSENRTARRAALTALTLLTALGAAQAAPPKLRVRPTFGGAYLPGGWQTIQVAVENPTDAPAVSGEVQVRLTDLRAGQSLEDVEGLYTAPVTLAPGESRLVPVLVRVPENMLPVTIVSLLQGSGDRATLLAQSRIDSLPVRPAGVNIVAATAEGGLDRIFSLNGLRFGVRREGGLLRIPAPQEQISASPAQVVPAIAAELPTEVAAYDSVAVVSLAPNITLSDAQLAALLGFVRRGGVVIDPKGRIDGALPDDSPEALSAALRARVGDTALFTSLEGRVARAPQDWQPLLDGSLLPAVQHGVGLQPPPFGALLLFLTGYLILAVPVQYLVLRRLDRREWAWVATPALALAFSIGAYGFARNQRAETVFQNRIGILEARSGEQVGTALGVTGIYSPQSARYELSLDAPQSVLWKAGREPGTLDLLQRDSRGALRGAAISQWSVKPFLFRTDAAPLNGAIRIDAHYDGQRLTVQVVNETRYAIQNAAIRIGQRVRELGTLAAGQDASYQEQIPEVVLTGNYGYTNLPVRGFKEGQMQMDQAVQSLVSDALAPRPSAATQVLLTGWVDDAILPATRVDGTVCLTHDSSVALVVHGALTRTKR